MREGLRSSTVSQRGSAVSQRKGDRCDSSRAVKAASEVGLDGGSNRVRNILPDLNAEVNPSEFDSDWLCEGGYAGDGSQFKGSLDENGVEGVDTGGSGEIGKGSVKSSLEKMDQSVLDVDGEVRKLVAKTADLNLEALDCDDLVCDSLRTSEETVLHKDVVEAVDGILHKNLGCDAEVAVFSEQNGFIENKMETVIADGNAGDDRSDLQSRDVVLGCCEENFACSIDSLGDIMDTVSQKSNGTEKDKMPPDGKAVRSRVAVSSCSLEKITCSMDSLEDRLETNSQKREGAEKDKLQAYGKVLRSRVVAATTEGQASLSSKRKKATLCAVNETEMTRNGENKKHNCIPGIPIEEENIPLKIVLHDKEAFAEEMKNDEGNEFVDTEETVAEEVKNDGSNEFFDGQNGRDDGCLERSRKKDEKTDSMSNTIDMKVLNNDISKELAVDPDKKFKVGQGRGRPKKYNEKCKVGQGRGRGRPRKYHVGHFSINPLAENIEDSFEDSLRIKEGNNQLTDHTDMQQKGSIKRSKKRKRGRPRKTDKEIDGKNPSKNKWNKFGNGSLNKRKRGRPRKINKENGAQNPISEDQEMIDIDKGLVAVRKKDNHQSFEGSMRQVRKQIVEGTQAEVNLNAAGTASPPSSLRLKRKRENAEDEPSTYESNLKITSSSKCNFKVKNSSTREEKNAIRQEIVDMLLSAGWTIEYKPRQGREYADSVYRSPEGRTHWSVTLAYRVLKHQVETGKAPNFCFTPIPEEKLSLLFRVSVKERSDKNKPKLKSLFVKSAGKRKGRKKTEHTSGGRENIADSLNKKKSSSAKSGKQNRRRCALLVRGSGAGSNTAAQEFMAVSGKHSILSWMIECGVIPPGGKVHCRRRTKVLKEGTITKDGIHCSCCSKLHSVARFEAHAGLRSCPVYQNLYLDNGSSLLQCQMETWIKQEESVRLGFHKVDVGDDPNDDTCGICGDGGNLICCDGCPSTFHQTCLDIPNFPSGDWHCVYCSCKYCGTTAGGKDQDEDKHDELQSLLTCCLCGGKYHSLCADERDCEYDQSSGSAFCGKSCEKIFEHFMRLVGVRAEVGDGYTCTLIKRPDSTSAESDVLEPKEIENRSKLAVALSVMDECFLPIIDHRSGINLMRHTLYSCGSNFKRLNFRGFFTAILEKEDEIIAAACIRIHGKDLAEMPFIGTRNVYRRQGMCRRLLSGIEMALRSLSIEKLVIPAVSEVAETWTSVFGFEPLGGLGNEMRHMNIIVFPGVDMLQKPLLNHQFDGDTTSDQEKDIKTADPCSKKHSEENGLVETKAEDGCLSEKLSSESGNLVPLEPTPDDQIEDNESRRVYRENNPSTPAKDENLDNESRRVDLENNPSTPAKDETCPVGVSDQVVLSSEEPVQEAKLSFSEHDAHEDTAKISESTNCSMPENCVTDPSSKSAYNNDQSTSRINLNNPDEEKTDFPCLMVHEIKKQSSASDGSLLLVTDGSGPNGAQANAMASEEFGSDLQIDCKIVTQFSLEKSCTMDSSSNNLGSPAKFHSCATPEVGSK